MEWSALDWAYLNIRMYYRWIYKSIGWWERPAILHSGAFVSASICIVIVIVDAIACVCVRVTLRRLSVLFENCIPDAILKQGNWENLKASAKC